MKNGVQYLIVVVVLSCSSLLWFQHEYLGYISKKTQKRQAAVITLSDRNAEKIKEIELKKEEMLTKFEKQKQGTIKMISYFENDNKTCL